MYDFVGVKPMKTPGIVSPLCHTSSCGGRTLCILPLPRRNRAAVLGFRTLKVLFDAFAMLAVELRV